MDEDALVIDDPLAVAGRDVVAARVVRNFDDFPSGPKAAVQRSSVDGSNVPMD